MFRVLQNLNSETNVRVLHRKKSPSGSERRRRRLARAQALEESGKRVEINELSAKDMSQTDWGDPWDQEVWPCVKDDDRHRLVDLISRASVDEVNEASRLMNTWGTFIDDSYKYDVWRPTLDFLLCSNH